VFLPDSFVKMEVAHSWEVGKTAGVLLIWTLVGIIFSVKKFKWANS
jgi:ABC-2 type transport system permease protein